MTSKEQLIARIVRAARKPCPPIVELCEAVRPDGSTYSAYGAISLGGSIRKSGRFAYYDGKTYFGSGYKSALEAREAWDSHQDANGIDFQDALLAMNDSDLKAQRDYWLPEEATT